MRKFAASLRGIGERHVARVVSLQDLVAEWQPGISFLVRVTCPADVASVEGMVAAGVDGIFILAASDEIASGGSLPVVRAARDALQIGDVVALTPDRAAVDVLFREADLHHTVFLTNRCNSYCLMCSQPPTRHDDSWLVDEAKRIATHVRSSPKILGFSGGEPLLLGANLRTVLEIFAKHHPNTVFDVLTNGRLFGDKKLAKELLDGLSVPVSWMVPLYGHADFLHDYVVQTPGAFDQTINGLLSLQAYKQPIQLRIVLIEPVLQILPDLCEFIGRNLPFVREVALMGCEPEGFALANRDVCEVDIQNWHSELVIASRNLRRAGVPALLMNLPLCALPTELWPLANRSISDWKQVYAPECDKCSVREKCSGLFAWYQKGWRPTAIQPIEEAAPT